MDEQKQSYTLLTIVVVAIIAIAGGVLWYSLRAPAGSDYDFDATTNPLRDGRTISAQSESIIIYIPQQKERVGTPLIIQGEAKINEGTIHTVNFRLLDAVGKELAVGYAVSDSLEFGQFGAFRGELNFISDIDQEGTLEIYRIIKESGSEIDKVVIPVTITKTPEFIKG